MPPKDSQISESRSAAPSGSTGVPPVTSPASFLLPLLLIFGALTLWLATKSPTTTDPEEPTRSAQRLNTLATLHVEDAIKLSTHAWIDRKKGMAQIPIESAMELVIPQLNAAQPHPSGPIASPTPTSVAPN